MAVTGTIVVDGITLTADQVERAAKDLAQGPDVLVRLRPQLARKLEALMGWSVTLPDAIRDYRGNPLIHKAALTAGEMDVVRQAVTRGILQSMAATRRAVAPTNNDRDVLQGGPCNPMPGAPTPNAIAHGFRASDY